ncbi:MAG: Crp/Fnr family transcriptional regulator [Bacteroidota bacterium]
MNSNPTLNESLHSIERVKKGDFFLEYGSACTKIGMLKQGVMRGFVYNEEGEEITTHFYQEGDMIIGSNLPNVQLSMTVQALEDCEISIANYSEVMSYVNKDENITEVITSQFQKLNQQLQSRLVSLLNLDALQKYEQFLTDYPALLNRIPHYYIAQYLGITPTQLSRVRRQFINKCT